MKRPRAQDIPARNEPATWNVTCSARTLRSCGDVALSCPRSGDCAFFSHLHPHRIGPAAWPSTASRRCTGDAASGARGASHGGARGASHGRARGAPFRAARSSHGGACAAYGRSRTTHGGARTAFRGPRTPCGRSARRCPAHLRAAAQFRGPCPAPSRDATRCRTASWRSADCQGTCIAAICDRRRPTRQYCCARTACARPARRDAASCV